MARGMNGMVVASLYKDKQLRIERRPDEQRAAATFSLLSRTCEDHSGIKTRSRLYDLTSRNRYHPILKQCRYNKWIRVFVAITRFNSELVSVVFRIVRTIVPDVEVTVLRGRHCASKDNLGQPAGFLKRKENIF
ncbi:uncharacterized protein LOC114255683 [Monomorium pharaonis]|uniref:uncharacterized protein LOC114255683 n=1 Tax=Monomorium pharaonis TaxID=307658 RepID=UPI00102E21A5|nr:uncharacterized protein LOC114255683 [Monomorium pharaonis]